MTSDTRACVLMLGGVSRSGNVSRKHRFPRFPRSIERETRKQETVWWPDLSARAGTPGSCKGCRRPLAAPPVASSRLAVASTHPCGAARRRRAAIRASGCFRRFPAEAFPGKRRETVKRFPSQRCSVIACSATNYGRITNVHECSHVYDMGKAGRPTPRSSARWAPPPSNSVATGKRSPACPQKPGTHELDGRGISRKTPARIPLRGCWLRSRVPRGTRPPLYRQLTRARVGRCWLCALVAGHTTQLELPGRAADGCSAAANQRAAASCSTAEETWLTLS